VSGKDNAADGEGEEITRWRGLVAGGRRRGRCGSRGRLPRETRWWNCTGDGEWWVNPGWPASGAARGKVVWGCRGLAGRACGGCCWWRW